MAKRKRTLDQQIRDRRGRHDELLQMYVRFEAIVGREPTHRELWTISPPREATA